MKGRSIVQSGKKSEESAAGVSSSGVASPSRRRLLVTLGLAGASAMAAPLGQLVSQAASAQQPATTRQWTMVIDLRKCEGCVTTGKPPQCTEACNVEHFVPRDQAWIKVLRLEQPNGRSYFLPRLCMQCENAPCLNVCPVKATYRDAEGVILIDHRRCIGCRLCMAACPYSARYFNWGEPENPPGATFAQYSPEYPVPHRRGTAEKCMLCAHRTRDGKLPACVSGCPMMAIYLGDLVEDVATNGMEVLKLSRFLAENNAFRLLEELGTRPRVWYIPGHGQDYGRHSDDPRAPQEARPWQEQEPAAVQDHMPSQPGPEGGQE